MRLYGQNGVLPYRSVDELQRALMSQVRRFRRTVPSRATAAVINLSGPGLGKPAPRKVKASPELQQLDEMAHQLQILNNMVLQLKTNFVGQARAGAALKAVQSFGDIIKAKMESHRRKVAEAARGQISRGMVLANGSIVKAVEETLKRRYSAVNESYMIAPVTPFKQNEGGTMCEIGYVRIADLKGTDGFTHAQFFIVIASPLDHVSTSASRFWVATLTDYRTPSKIKWEAEAKNPQELRSIVADLMAQDGVLGKAFPRDVPIPAENVKFQHPNVKNTEVKGGIVTVFVKNKKLVKQTRDELRSELTGIVRNFDPKNRDVIRDQVDMAKGEIKFVFSLPNRLRGRIVPKDTLTKIKQLLNLDDSELKRVKTALEDPE